MATDTVQPTPYDDPAGATSAEGSTTATTGPDTSATPGADLDPTRMQAILDGRYAEVRDLVRSNLVDFADILTDAETLSTDDYRDRVRDLLLEMAASGQTGMGFPTEYGGGGDVGASISAFETLAYGDLSVLVKAGVQFGLFGGAVLHLGTKHHHDRYLRPLISGELMGGFAMSESGHGSNVQALRTHATYDPATQEFVVTTDGDLGRKDYIGNAARHGEVAAVFAQLHVGGEDKGVHAFLVPIRERGEDGGLTPAPGVRIEDCGHKMGLNGVDNGRLWFDGVRIPRTALLNRFADVTPEGVYESSIDNPDRRFFTTLGTLVQGRISVGGAGLGAAKVAITLGVRYGDLRRQFEAADPDREQLLLDYGMHQRRLLPLLARTYALHFAQEKLVGELHLMSGVTDDESRQRELESRAAGTKALATWHATRTIQECREACGGAGYLSANRFAALKADTDVFTTFEGDNHVLLQLVAKGLLTGYASEFEDMNQLDMARFVGELAVETVIERTSVHKLLERIRDVLPGFDDGEPEAGLADPDYQLAMYRFREEHLVSGVARRLKRGIDAGHHPGAVFSRVQDHVIAAARAHVERLVLEDFTAKVSGLDDGPEKDALRLLRDLHALSGIEADRAWFIEHGRLSVARSKAITREVGELCRAVRPIAVPLVESFGVPDAMLRSPDLLDERLLAEEPTR